MILGLRWEYLFLDLNSIESLNRWIFIIKCDIMVLIFIFDQTFRVWNYVEAMVSDEMEPQINADERRLNALSEQIIGAAFEVSNVLGAGFLEKVYENALNVELNLRGLKTFQQAPLKVFYNEELVGDYIADILVENEIIIEVKAVKDIDTIHFAQCLNYLRITRLKLCLLLNFQ